MVGNEILNELIEITNSLDATTETLIGLQENAKYEDAIKTLTNITKLYGDNPFFFFDMACCYEELGNEKMYKYYCAKRDKYWKDHGND